MGFFDRLRDFWKQELRVKPVRLPEELRIRQLAFDSWKFECDERGFEFISFGRYYEAYRRWWHTEHDDGPGAA